VTSHQGCDPDSEDVTVIFRHENEYQTMAFYRVCIPPLPGTVIAVWRLDGSLITFTSGGPVY
jgi:hypothetical protein